MNTDSLSRLGLFSNLEPQQLDVLKQYSAIRSYPKNTVIIHEDDDASSLYAIESGKVEVYLNNEDGREIIINELSAGDTFGELGLIDDAPRSASIRTTKASKMIVIQKSGFDEVLSNHPELGLHILKHLTKRVRALSYSIRSLALMDVYGRVARLFLDLAEEEGGVLVIQHKLTQQDIANRIGASREMVARIMKELIKGGYIRQQGGTLIINESLSQS